MVRKVILVGVLVLLPASTSYGQTTRKTPAKGTITLDLPFPRIKVVAKRTATKKNSKPAALRPTTIRRSKTEATHLSAPDFPPGPKLRSRLTPPSYSQAPPARPVRPARAMNQANSWSSGPRVWTTPIRGYGWIPNAATAYPSYPVNPPQWKTPLAVSRPYSSPPSQYYSPSLSKRSKREAAIVHLEAAAQLLRQNGNGKSVGAIRQVIAQQRQTALREMIAQKEAQLKKLKKEITQLTAGLQPRRVLVKMTVSKMDMEKISKHHKNAIPTCCAKGKCNFHVVEAPLGFQVDHHIRQLQKSGALKILARPQIITLDGRMTRFEMAMNDGNGNPVISSLEIRPKIVANNIHLGVGLKCKIPTRPGQAYSRPAKLQSHAAELQCTIPNGQSALMSRVIRIGGTKKSNMALVITVTPVIVPAAERLAISPLPRLPIRPKPQRAAQPIHREAQKKSVADVIQGFFFGVTR